MNLTVDKAKKHWWYIWSEGRKATKSNK